MLQALVPAVALSRSALHGSFTGGTDVPWSPTSDYLVSTLRPAFATLGIEFECRILRRGYYPRGGGNIEVVISPCSRVNALVLPKRGPPHQISLVSRCGSLPRHVAERQASSALSVLKQKGIPVGESKVATEESISPGSSILVSLVGRECFIGADGLGRRGVRAEQVGQDAANRFAQAYSSGASVDENLADTIAPLLCAGGSPSSFYVREITEHLRTSLHVARLFTGADFEFSKSETCWLVKIYPQQNS